MPGAAPACSTWKQDVALAIFADVPSVIMMDWNVASWILLAPLPMALGWNSKLVDNACHEIEPITGAIFLLN